MNSTLVTPYLLHHYDDSSSSNSNKTPPPTAATNVVAANAVAVKIPPFSPSDPDLWIAQVEAQFKAKNITSQGTKFAHVVAALSLEAATEVRDLILTPPSTNPLDVLKATLTGRVSFPSVERSNNFYTLKS
jgi:hypothetical protein